MLMGFIVQLLGLHLGDEDKVEEKVGLLVKSGNNLLQALESERNTENELAQAERDGNLDRVFELQKKEIRLAMESLDDIRNIQFELLSLEDDEKKQIDDFIIDAKRLLLEGVPQHEERSLLEKLRHQKKDISNFMRKARYKS